MKSFGPKGMLTGIDLLVYYVSEGKRDEVNKK